MRARVLKKFNCSEKKKSNKMSIIYTFYLIDKILQFNNL